MLWIIHPSSSLLSSSLNEIPSAAQCIHHTRRTQHTLFLSLSRARSLSIYPCGVSTNRNHRLMTRWSSSSLQSHLKTLSTFSIPHHGACMRSAIASLRWQCAAISFWPPVPFAESNCKISWLQSVHGASSTDWTQTKYIYIAFSFCVRLSICLWPQHIQPNYSITYQLSKTLENRQKKNTRELSCLYYRMRAFRCTSFLLTTDDCAACACTFSYIYSSILPVCCELISLSCN